MPVEIFQGKTCRILYAKPFQADGKVIIEPAGSDQTGSGASLELDMQDMIDFMDKVLQENLGSPGST